MLNRLSLLVALLLLPAVAYAQSATVYGTVNEIVGDQYYPIAFAKVTLSNAEFATHPVVPDIEGKFVLNPVPAGVYRLSVSAVGFASITREVELAEDDSVRVRVRLGDEEIAGIMIEPADGYMSGQRLGGAER